MTDFLRVQACKFVEGKQIVALDTLASTLPTLAVLAYDARIRYVQPNETWIGNPASIYCHQLGGTDASDTPTSYLPDPRFKVGWYYRLKDGKFENNVYDFCMFPDGSAMDPWTLFRNAECSKINPKNPCPKAIKFGYKPRA
jgi:putative hemolysin